MVVSFPADTDGSGFTLMFTVSSEGQPFSKAVIQMLVFVPGWMVIAWLVSPVDQIKASPLLAVRFVVFPIHKDVLPNMLTSNSAGCSMETERDC